MPPTVIIDSREQNPLSITAYPTEVAKLDYGDYGIRGASDLRNPEFIVERKSLSDLIGSLTSGRERFMKECEQLDKFRFKAILVEADQRTVETGDYISSATPQSIVASIDAIRVRMGIHVIFCGSHAGAAIQLERLVRQYLRGIEKLAKAVGIGG